MENFAEARSVDSRFQEFFGTCEFYLRGKMDTLSKQNQRLNGEHKQLMNELDQLKDEVHKKMCDNFDFPGVLRSLLNYCKQFALYAQKNKEESKIVVLLASKNFVHDVLYSMGLDYSGQESKQGNSDLI